jgi:tripartite-type tricarboxylate transporter receptor subunit TctC
MNAAFAPHGYGSCKPLLKAWGSRLFFVLPLLALSSALACGHAVAQDFPSKPFRVVVPFAPGGPTDLVARTVGQKLTAAYGQPVVVDNRAGAGGVVGTDIVAKSAGDGYTLLLCSRGALAVSPFMLQKTPYDTLRDIATVTMVVSIPYLLIVGTASPFKSIKELIAAAQARPGEFSYGSAGIASTSHLASELFRSMAKIKLIHVPYKGGAPAAADLIGGQLQLVFEPVPTALPLVRGNRVRALGISSVRRFEQLPELPTISESGLPGYEMATWSGICAPSSTPQRIVNRLNQDIVRGMSTQETRERFATLSAEIVTSTPQGFRAFLVSEMQTWSRLIKESDIQGN